jgi:hypothetical protein
MLFSRKLFSNILANVIPLSFFEGNAQYLKLITFYVRGWFLLLGLEFILYDDSSVMLVLNCLIR